MRHAQVPDAPGPVAVTIDGATTSIVMDDIPAEVQDEQVELVAERMEAMRSKQGEEVCRTINDLYVQTDLGTPFSVRCHVLSPDTPVDNQQCCFSVCKVGDCVLVSSLVGAARDDHGHACALGSKGTTAVLQSFPLICIPSHSLTS